MKEKERKGKKRKEKKRKEKKRKGKKRKEKERKGKKRKKERKEKRKENRVPFQIFVYFHEELGEPSGRLPFFTTPGANFFRMCIIP